MMAALLLITQLVAAVSAGAGYHAQQHTVPKISIHQLQESDLNLHKLLHESGGVLRLSTKQPNHDDSLIYNIRSYRNQALTALCTCSAFEKSSSSHPNGDELFNQLLEKHPKDIQQIQLPDGSTRRTLATATVGFDGNNVDATSSYPLQLPTWFQEQCGHDAYDSMENLRDAVSKVVHLFVDKLDHEKQRDKSYSQVLQSANHLEHFHVYFKGEEIANEGMISANDNKNINVNTGNEDLSSQTALDTEVKNPETAKTTTLDYHTDAGFFLSFVPAMNCHSNSVDNSSLYIKSQEQPLQFDEDEVVILVGAAAQYWMNTNTDDDEGDKYSFLAASHALKLHPGAHRSWYGKMHLIPSSLTSSTFHASTPSSGNSHSSVRYGDVLPTFQLENYKANVPAAPVDGCGISPLEPKQLIISTSMAQAKDRHSRRRLQHVGSPANCNNETNFFCWYQCLSIPDSGYTLDYLRDGFSLYCLDPSMLSENSVADAASPCKNGYTHNSDCSGSWQLTDSSLPGYEFPNYASALEEGKAAASAGYPTPDDGDEYCFGGTSMFMDGFNWIGSTCVIYLFPQWTLSTPGKFALACLSSILFGILLEYVLWKRRAVYTMMPGRRRLILSVLVYGLQLTMGYLIMLVIMTYSGPLFVSIVGGMMIGHALFNAQDSFMKWKDGPDKSSQEAGAGTSELGPRTSTELASSYQNVNTSSRNSSEVDDEEIRGCCGLGGSDSKEKPFGATEKTKLKESIPEGATPCCQYVL